MLGSTNLALHEQLRRHRKISSSAAIEIADSSDILRYAKRLSNSDAAVLDEGELPEGGDGLVPAVCDYAVCYIIVSDARLLQQEQWQKISRLEISNAH